MRLHPPTRLAFWRFVFALSAVLPILSVFQVLRSVAKLGVDLSASRPWLGLVGVLSLMGLLAVLLLTATWSRYREQVLSFAELPARVSDKWHGVSLFLLTLALSGYSLVFMAPFMQRFFGEMGWMRFLIFWFFSLLGLWGVKLFRKDASWFVALIAILLCQSVLHLMLVYWPRVTDYPFAMGWSETSRYYYPSLFVSPEVYGQRYPWPILHPTLHLLLAPPYLFDASLWFHRFWQVVIRYALVAAVVPALMSRLAVRERPIRWLAGLWMFLFLFMGPIYFHLAVPVILVLLGYSSQHDRRTWIAVILASIWCGWSRVNWYPMPGMIAAVLYLLEVPYRGRNLWNYLFKPASWFVVGTLIAVVAQRIYVLLSGVPDPGIFFTSLASDLLLYRLWPNASYFLGVLPAAILASLPIWIAMWIIFRSRPNDWHPLRLALILAALLVLFLGGLVVSLKIGGGANLHNMDAYFSLLLIVFAYLVFARYRSEHQEVAQPVALHWLLVVSLIVMPAWSYLQFNIGSVHYDKARTQQVLTTLQSYVDQVDGQGGQILFITQRHLISMHMLQNVTLIPEYEREDLMEIAMSDNVPYLEKFRKDMEAQRFALIVVDPLNYNLLSKNRSFAEENNVWVTRIMKSILCNYRQAEIFPADEIALYVPQEGARQCP